MRIVTTLAAAAAATLLLVGCSASNQPPSGSPAPQAVQSADADATQQFLGRHGLTGQTADQIVDKLDRTLEDRTAGPIGSVRPDQLILADDQGQVSLPINDRFYLAFAPYINRTHECFNHNLATCQGELVEQEMQVTITADDGRTLVNEPMTSFANGFIGVWLPKDVQGQITVEHDGKSVTAPISTGAEDPTCLTTLQLA